MSQTLQYLNYLFSLLSMLFIVLTTPASCISYTLLIAVAKSAIKHGSSPYAYLSGEERGKTLGQYKQQSFVKSRK